MSRKKKMLRALHHHNPSATTEEAFEWGWKHGQGYYASRRIQQLETQLKAAEAKRDRLRGVIKATADRLEYSEGRRDWADGLRVLLGQEGGDK